MSCLQLANIPAPIRVAPGTARRPPWRRAFLRELARHGNVTRACEIAGVSVRRAYQVRASSPRFRDAWKEANALARETILDALCDAVYRRGVEGWEVPIIRAGRVVGYRWKYSFRCLVLCLEMYGSKYAPSRRGCIVGPPAPALVDPFAPRPELVAATAGLDGLLREAKRPRPRG